MVRKAKSGVEEDEPVGAGGSALTLAEVDLEGVVLRAEMQTRELKSPSTEQENERRLHQRRSLVRSRRWTDIKTYGAISDALGKMRQQRWGEHTSLPVVSMEMVSS